MELGKQGITASAQESIKVYCDSQVVGDFFADLLIENRLILELKSVSKLCTSHEVQLVNYLNATGIEDGLLINFGPDKVEVMHKYKIYKP